MPKIAAAALWPTPALHTVAMVSPMPVAVPMIGMLAPTAVGGTYPMRTSASATEPATKTGTPNAPGLPAKKTVDGGSATGKDAPPAPLGVPSVGMVASSTLALPTLAVVIAGSVRGWELAAPISLRRRAPFRAGADVRGESQSDTCRTLCEWCPGYARCVNDDDRALTYSARSSVSSCGSGSGLRDHFGQLCHVGRAETGDQVVTGRAHVRAVGSRHDVGEAGHRRRVRRRDDDRQAGRVAHRRA